jgi:hypothetical protein
MAANIPCHHTRTRNRSLFILLMLAGLAGLSACSNPQAPNRRNFTAAINRAISDSIFVSLEEMSVGEFNGGHGGRRLAKFEQRFETGDHYLKIRRQLFSDRKRELLIADLVRSGILIPWMDGYYTGQGPSDTPWDIYLFKTAQLRHARAIPASGSLYWQFYCGHPGVEKIVGWTEPGEASGVKVSNVTYRARLFDSPGWVSGLGKYLDETLGGDKEAMLVLGPDGWHTR